ncbi:hypothetical protein ACFLUU_06665 [Chloroflexota bacterium]
MKQKLTWYVGGVLILGLALLAVSCGGETSVPAAEEKATPAAEEKATPAAEEEAVAEEPTTTTGGPSATPHTLEGREDCMMCHTSGTYAVPADHAGRANDTCTACHQPVE